VTDEQKIEEAATEAEAEQEGESFNISFAFLRGSGLIACILCNIP
jgi:hypothetical protein